MAEVIGYGEWGYGQGAYGGFMTKTASVTVTLEEKGKLGVTVEDGSGSAISDASVNISGTQSDSGQTDSNGKVVFTGIEIGDYTIEVRKQGYFDGQVTISASDFS